MRTEIDKDFTIERHKEYTVIGPFRTYADEEDKEENSEEGFEWFILGLVVGIPLLLFILLD